MNFFQYCFRSVVAAVSLLPMALGCSNQESASGKAVSRSSYDRGVEAFQKGEFDLAITCFNEAIRLDPTDANAYYGRANAYNKKGEHDKAIADLNEAIRLDPKNGTGVQRAGLLLQRQGRIR